ncbi:acyltransferase [Jiangella endophytica]|uniref:acyltransferase n=1 Tax=Jiangella endophytica TaxID=1623398 RepID=UPI000E351755|nr:acyltransferase [Jiangella endophytica]
MTVWSWLDGGWSYPQSRTWGQRLTNAVGSYKARRHPGVHVPRSCRIHPEARLQPRAGSITFGENCLVAPHAVIQGDVTFGTDCSVQPFAVIVGNPSAGGGPPGRITIGNGVRIAAHAMIIAANHVFDDVTRPIHGQGLRSAPITIDDDVWVAGRVSIMAGVRVGAGSVLAAGAVVTKDVPRGSVVAGVPARVIRTRA